MLSISVIARTRSANIHVLNRLSKINLPIRHSSDISIFSYPANQIIEDKYDILNTTTKGGNWKIGAVFDGHCGHQVSTYMSKELLPEIVKNISSLSENNSNLATAVVEAFKSVEERWIDSIRDLYNRGLVEFADAGSCVCTALVYEDAMSKNKFLTVANLGDCRAILGSFDQYPQYQQTYYQPPSSTSSSSSTSKALSPLYACMLTRDHNAREPLEQKVLMDNHPDETLRELVLSRSRTACYVKGRLQLTRAFGK